MKCTTGILSLLHLGSYLGVNLLSQPVKPVCPGSQIFSSSELCVAIETRWGARAREAFYGGVLVSAVIVVKFNINPQVQYVYHKILSLFRKERKNQNQKKGNPAYLVGVDSLYSIKTLCLVLPFTCWKMNLNSTDTLYKYYSQRNQQEEETLSPTAACYGDQNN